MFGPGVTPTKDSNQHKQYGRKIMTAAANDVKGDPTELPSHDVKLSDVAAEKVRSLLEQEGRDDLRLRIAVQPGGCSGLIYQLYFDERVLDGDAVRDFDGVEVIVDKMSVPYLAGASIDFEDTIAKQGFTIDNPSASGSCACGDSFH
ncbi:iron-sulfur cluster insertion protein ErpA [Glutamicibacter endophyticus]